MKNERNKLLINLLKKHIAQVCKCKVFHNFLCSPLEGEPKSLISKGGKISQCCGLLRHFVEKISHFGINVPHNDREICSLAPSDSAEQNNSVNCFVRGLGLGRGVYVHFFFFISMKKEKAEPKKKNTND